MGEEQRVDGFPELGLESLFAHEVVDVLLALLSSEADQDVLQLGEVQGVGHPGARVELVVRVELGPQGHHHEALGAVPGQVHLDVFGREVDDEGAVEGDLLRSAGKGDQRYGVGRRR